MIKTCLMVVIILSLNSGRVCAQEPGATAPAITFEHSFQGPAADTIDWKVLEGQTVVLEFWATW